MCIAQTNKRHLTIVSKKSSISSLSLTTTTKRPRLPGRFAASARLNLNRLWSELEEMYVSRTSSSVLVLPATTTTTSSFNHQLQDTEDADQQNRINEEREQQLLKTNS